MMKQAGVSCRTRFTVLPSLCSSVFLELLILQQSFSLHLSNLLSRCLHCYCCFADLDWVKLQHELPTSHQYKYMNTAFASALWTDEVAKPHHISISVSKLGKCWVTLGKGTSVCMLYRTEAKTGPRRQLRVESFTGTPEFFEGWCRATRSNTPLFTSTCLFYSQRRVPKVIERL